MKKKLFVLVLLISVTSYAQTGSLFPTINPETNRYGLADVEGNLVLPCEYDYAAVISENLYVMANMYGRLAFFSKDGTQLTDHKYVRYGTCNDGLVRVLNTEGKTGYINEYGKEIIECQYDDALDFSHGLAPVLRTKIVPGATMIFNEQEGYLEPTPSWGYINTKGIDVFDCAFDEAYPFIEGLAPVVLDGKYGFIDDNCNLIVKAIYDKVTHFVNGIALVCLDGKWGCITKDNHHITPCKYDDIHNFKDGYAAVKIESKWTYLNREGEIATTERYDYAGDFSNGYAAVLKNNIVFYVDKNFSKLETINGNYESAYHITNDIACIKDNGKYGYIHLSGKQITGFIYDEAFPFENGVAIAKFNGKYGVINTDGQCIVPFEYEDANYPILSFKIFQYNNFIDVDRNIPVLNKNNENMFAIILANENYNNTSSVDFAINDGKIFKEYCNKTLGIPEQNIKYKENATLNNIRSQINWVKDITKVYNGNAKVIFYYAGHGIPDETNNSSYLLPIDGIGNDPRSAYSLNELYSQLGELPAKQITVFMDACFSGAKRDGNMLTSARSVAIKAKSGTPKGNMVVFSAAQGDETAHQYNKKKHGMFTYFLLKKMQETKGEASLEELATYIKVQVEKCSVIENGKLQTPTIQVSPHMQSSIKNISLK